MNVKALTLCALGAVLSLGATIGVSAQTPTAPVVHAGRMGRMGREKHPELQAALKALRNAKLRLEKADHDFQGHRVKAIEHINESIKEIELAIDSDRH